MPIKIEAQVEYLLVSKMNCKNKIFPKCKCLLHAICNYFLIILRPI